ncbi:MAG: hypothetical protein EPO25_14285 [Gammaproteobacteria bacterium]|nr:MAG: hypothetical protein EPO25_14285 [Gammaproteobacteria bacterium]
MSTVKGSKRCWRLGVRHRGVSWLDNGRRNGSTNLDVTPDASGNYSYFATMKRGGGPRAHR